MKKKISLMLVDEFVRYCELNKIVDDLSEGDIHYELSPFFNRKFEGPAELSRNKIFSAIEEIYGKKME